MIHKLKISRSRTAPTAVRGRLRRPGLPALVGLVVLVCLACASPALAGPPVHPPLPDPIGGFPLDHACGTAVDSQGDIYVSNAGESKIEVFDSSGTHITSIPNSNTPCGLSVNSHGDLFVSEQATGNVVRYIPNTYPFAGTPTFGAGEAIDASGSAKGIAIDTGLRFSTFPLGRDDSLYVAKGDHVDAYGNERQQIHIEATGGTFKLKFDGQETPPLAYNASHAAVQSALEALTTIGPHNVSVTTAGWQATDHLVTFTHKLGLADVSPIEVDATNLTGGVGKSETNGGLIAANIGAGVLTDATGVAAYAYRNSTTVAFYVFAVDTATDQVRIFSGTSLASLTLHRTIGSVDQDRDPGTPSQDLGFGEAGAYLAVDPGNEVIDRGAEVEVTQKCEEQVDEQACTAGHVLLYDAAHNVVDEFQADGEFLDQLTSEGFADAKPTALAVDRSGTATDGRLYVTAGDAAAAKLLAFAPLTAPSRSPRPDLSHVLSAARRVAVDEMGNVYVAAGPLVHVFGPDGTELEVGPQGEGIVIAEPPAYGLAVDSECRLYTYVNQGTSRANEKVQYYSPLAGACPPANGAEYGGPVTVADGNSFVNPNPGNLSAIGLNPANDHLFVAGQGGQALIELDSAAPGHESKIIDHCFACTSNPAGAQHIAVYGRNGDVYMSSVGAIVVVDPTGSEVLARITGVGSSEPGLGGSVEAIAVDQSNGHALAFRPALGVAEEYEASGTFVKDFGSFVDSKFGGTAGIAVDNSGGPNDGDVYVAYDTPTPGAFDLTAFGPLAYGEPPQAALETTGGVGGGAATLNGTVNPNGFALTGCRFEYLLDSQYQQNRKSQEENEEPDEPFVGAASKPCAESLAEIGSGNEPVAVHADLSGLDPAQRYRFRLIVENKYGTGVSPGSGLFGPPLLKAVRALPVLYDEATLQAEVDPSGLPTEYHFEYVTREHFEAEGFEQAQQTPVVGLGPGDGYSVVKAPLTGLVEGTEYRFRILVGNEAAALEEADVLITLERLGGGSCPNAEYRTGFSAQLPDCRAYELVTPAESRGSRLLTPDPGNAGGSFNIWLAKPRGEGAGERLVYGSLSTLPGFDGTGSEGDTYRAQRTPGAHPEAGWATELFSPTFAENGGETAKPHGIAEEQRYGFFPASGQGSFPRGEYLRTPAGLEPLGKGSLGTDMEARGRFIGRAGAHVIFSSKVELEPGAAPAGTESLYDRAAGAASSELVSGKPDGGAFGAGEDARYVAATEDGSGVLFRVAGTLYLHHAGESIEIAQGPNAFAGVSPDASRVLYAAVGAGSQPGGLNVCDTQAGPCAGPGAHAPTEIASDAVFVNVSSDGSRVYFFSEEALTGEEENQAGEKATAGEPNLYAWDGVAPRFLAILDPRDVEPHGFADFVDLGRWSQGISAGSETGLNQSPTRSTPHGEVLVFQSHARLTAYDNEGATEVYRYAAAAPPGEAIVCVSCDPSGVPPGSDARLLEFSSASVAAYFGLVPNVTDDGEAVFFQSLDRLLPEDANEAEDVYEWRAKGHRGCERPDGCLALISSGQGEAPSYLYSMSADGRDVFFATPEKLVREDVAGSPSLYDARVEGGIPSPLQPVVCHGDACQGAGGAAPALADPVTTGAGESSAPSRPCPKGRRKVTHNGKVRCAKRRHRHAAPKHKRGGHR